MNEGSFSSRSWSGASDGEPASFFARLRRFVAGARKGEDPVREALEELIEEQDSGSEIDLHERLILGNVLHLRDLTAHDVMIPRVDIVAVDAASSLIEVIDAVVRCGHSRLPVYRKTLDDVLGMIHIKDLLPMAAKDRVVGLRHLIRRLLFVSPSVRALDLLVEMRQKRTHMALVVDEYGGIDGLVSIEDLIEQIVGDIEDEHETEPEPEMLLAEDGVLTADARTPLEDFEERFGVVFAAEDKENAETLGGLASRLAGRVPMRGELIRHDSGLEFEIADADSRRIRRLRVHNLPGAKLFEREPS